MRILRGLGYVGAFLYCVIAAFGPSPAAHDPLVVALLWLILARIEEQEHHK